MPFPTMEPISWKFTGQPYDLNSILTPDQVWAKLDVPAEEVRQALISLINSLNSQSASSSVGFTPNADVDPEADTVQTSFDALVNLIHGTGGATWLKSVGVTGLTGDNVQTLLESLKAYIDTKNTAQTSALNTHKASSDHDGRYYTESEIDTKVASLNNADTANSSALTAHKNSSDHDSRYYTENESDAKFETISDLTNNRKLSATGDFRGTLNGYPIVQADPGYSSMVAGINDTLNAHLAESAFLNNLARYDNVIFPRHKYIGRKLRNGAFRGLGVGDSIGAGSGSSSSSARWTWVLATKLQVEFGGNTTDWNPYNYAVGGSTIENIVPYLAHVLDSTILPSRSPACGKPYWVIMTGRNDCAYLSLDNFSLLYRIAVKMGIRAGIDVICCTEPPYLNMSTGEITDPDYPAFAEEIKKIAFQEGASFVDVRQEWLYRQAIDGTDLTTLTADGVHPNDAGYEIIADLIYHCIIGNPVIPTLSVSDDVNSRLYAVSQFNHTTLTSASVVPISDLTTNTTSRKEVLGTADMIQIDNGGSVTFGFDKTKIYGIIVSMINESGSGTITVESPAGYYQVSGRAAQGSIVRESSYYVPIDPLHPATDGTIKIIATGTVYITGVTVLQPILTEKHDTIKGVETGVWNTVTSYGSLAWRESSNTTGDKITLVWYGTALSFNVYRGPAEGVIGWTTDGGAPDSYDCYYASGYLNTYIKIMDQEMGWHTTVIEVLPKNASSTNNKIDIRDCRVFALGHDDGSVVANCNTGITVHAPDGVNFVRTNAVELPTITDNKITMTSSGRIEAIRK